MNLVIKLAYRNLFRNTRRTVLTCLLLGCSLAALIFTDAIIIGMLDLMIESVTRTFAGEAQVHRKGFMDDLDVDLYIRNTDELEDMLERTPEVEGFSSRTMSAGMISSTSDMTGGLVYGVEPDREASVSKLKDAVVTGEYFSGKPNELLMGSGMADLLEVELGDRVVLTQARSGDGEISQALFRLSGTFTFGMRELDEGLIFIPLSESRKILAIGNGAHEIALVFRNAEDALRPGFKLYDDLSGTENEALNWMEISPQIAFVIEMVDYSTLIVGAVLFLLVSLGIINSMFMSIYERIYEFGVVKALGTRPIEIVALILTEALFLAFFGLVFGMILGGLGSWWASTSGLPMGEMEFEGVSFASSIKATITLEQYIVFPFWVIVLTLVAALYPARFASKIVPARALQRAL